MVKKSKFKVNVGKKAKVAIEWSDRPENYSNENKKHIISIISDRYGIPKESVRVSFKPVKYNEKGELVDLSSEVITNIQDPRFQIKLFQDYINENKIEGVDFEFIKKIDSEVNSKIDYDVYDKYRRYEIEWIEWDNFLSYGADNRFDFSELKGLTLLNSFPGNMGGKSNFAIDLISFLLFGKVQKPYTLAQCFNKFLDEKMFSVRGGIKIEGVSYIIERNVSRAKKRTGEWGDASQEVKYYQVINSEKEELSDFNKNEAGEHSIKTNKIIKEAIGSEKDFNMIISATGNDLDSLIDVGNTERGRLLSKWIGLYPLEEKDKLGKEQFKVYSQGLKSKLYNETDLLNENELALKQNEEYSTKIKELSERVSELDKLIKEEGENRDVQISSKRKIDDNILKLDITTVNKKLEDIEKDANIKKADLEKHKKDFEEVKLVVFVDDEYKKLTKNDKDYSIELNQIKNEINQLKTTNKNLIESEVCPTCKRKYEGLDNTETIKQNESKIQELIASGIKKKDQIDKNKLLIDKMDEDKKLFDKKLKLENLISIIPIQIENLRSDYREKKQLIKEYNENKESIDLNNKIDILLTNINAKIKAYTTERDNKKSDVDTNKRNISDNEKKTEKNKIIIQELKEEAIKTKNWNVYLEMIGKNGISKSVLRKTLPIINLELARLLEDVCDFEVEVALTDKNEVVFRIIKDGISSDLGGGSGFERTASALALRCVLAGISTMPRPNFITLDEILGKVAKENYDNIRNMYMKIENNYQFILHISHLDEIKEWHRNTVTIKKTDNISSVEKIINNTNNY